MWVRGWVGGVAVHDQPKSLEGGGAVAYQGDVGSGERCRGNGPFGAGAWPRRWVGGRQGSSMLQGAGVCRGRSGW